MGWLANFLVPPKQNQIKFIKKKKRIVGQLSFPTPTQTQKRQPRRSNKKKEKERRIPVLLAPTVTTGSTSWRRIDVGWRPSQWGS
jgi:hypothetical protein